MSPLSALKTSPLSGEFPADIEETKALLELGAAEMNPDEFADFYRHFEMGQIVDLVVAVREDLNQVSSMLVDQFFADRRAEVRNALRVDMDHLVSVAEGSQKAAIELACDDRLTKDQANRLVEVALRNIGRDRKWGNVVMELLAHHYDLLTDESKVKIDRVPDLSTLLSFREGRSDRGAKVLEFPKNRKVPLSKGLKTK